MATIFNKITLPAKSTSIASPQMYRGFSSVNTNSENFRLYDFDLIKQDILNHFNTRQGERLMNPQFGCIIWALIFEPLTEQVKDIILQNVNTIINYDPRVQAENVVITPYDTGLQIACVLKYLPYNIQQNLQLQFDQQNGLLSTF
jgi:phage baseplate assembly protein W